MSNNVIHPTFGSSEDTWDDGGDLAGGLLEMFPEDEIDAGPCIGAKCTLPDPHHTYEDCVTVEMIEFYSAEGRAEEIAELEFDCPLEMLHQIRRRADEFFRSTWRLHPEQRAAAAQEELRAVVAILEGIDPEMVPAGR